MKPYKINGKIVHGKALGRTVGMPTANLELTCEEILPESGVYATRITVDGKTYDSVTNVGKRPSVDGEDHVTVETYILDFDDEIYGKDVELEIRQFLRPVQKFSGLEEVHKQVQKDIEEVKKLS